MTTDSAKAGFESADAMDGCSGVPCGSVRRRPPAQHRDLGRCRQRGCRCWPIPPAQLAPVGRLACCRRGCWCPGVVPNGSAASAQPECQSERRLGERVGDASIGHVRAGPTAVAAVSRPLMMPCLVRRSAGAPSGVTATAATRQDRRPCRVGVPAVILGPA